MYSNVILYHKLPFSEAIVEDAVVLLPHSPNGVISFLEQSLIQGTDFVWIGSSLFSDRFPNESVYCFNFIERKVSTAIVRVPVSEADITLFHHKTCREGLWPLLHSFPDRFFPEAIHWAHFLDINLRFARAASAVTSPNGTVTIHDFNLWMVPHYLRKLRPDVNMCFSFHTPFPDLDSFSILPQRSDIVHSLLLCNTICFDTNRYATNFSRAVGVLSDSKLVYRNERPECSVKESFALSQHDTPVEIVFGSSRIKLSVFPEGTHLGLIGEIAGMDNVKIMSNNIRLGVPADVKLIFSSARLDFTKGTVPLLRCFERFMEECQSLSQNVHLILLVVCPEYSFCGSEQLLHDIRDRVTSINLRFPTKSGVRVQLIEQALSLEELISYFAAADIFWVPSLRDGMNITAKEYVVAKYPSNGVLILSEFAGASLELSDAIIVNPYFVDQMLEGLICAISMPVATQIERINLMYTALLKNSSSLAK